MTPSGCPLLPRTEVGIDKATCDARGSVVRCIFVHGFWIPRATNFKKCAQDSGRYRRVFPFKDFLLVSFRVQRGISADLTFVSMGGFKCFEETFPPHDFLTAEISHFQHRPCSS